MRDPFSWFDLSLGLFCVWILLPACDFGSKLYPSCCVVTGTKADGAPIIPISAQLKYNIDVVCEYICTKIPLPVRDFTSTPRLIVIRSFDVNKPGAEIEELKGGVAGGSILRGVLKLGDEIVCLLWYCLSATGGCCCFCLLVDLVLTVRW
jgi:hypothetical protein